MPGNSQRKGAMRKPSARKPGPAESPMTSTPIAAPPMSSASSSSPASAAPLHDDFDSPAGASHDLDDGDELEEAGEEEHTGLDDEEM